jgi:hypothetical protein
LSGAGSEGRPTMEFLNFILAREAAKNAKKTILLLAPCFTFAPSRLRVSQINPVEEHPYSNKPIVVVIVYIIRKDAGINLPGYYKTT